MNVQLLHGDARELLKRLADNSVDSVVTDPPYELGFMGKAWDNSGIAFNPEVWKECLRVLKPGGHLLSFGGSRTYHRMAVAIEDAGFEIRDQIMWLYGSGFPKSLDVSKAIDKAAGAKREVVRHEDRRGAFDGVERDSEGHSNEYGSITNKGAVAITAPATDAAKQWDGWGTALKPAHEPIVVARKPLIGTVAANVLEHGTGALNIDASRIPTDPEVDDPRLGGNGTWGTGAMAKNVYEGGYAGDVVGSSQLGRWPANVIHDGSDEVLSAFPTTESGKPGTRRKIATSGSMAGPLGLNDREEVGYGDKGSAARFFYCPKASKKDRDEGLDHFDAQPVAFSNQAIAEMKRGNLRAESEIGLNDVKLRKNNHPTVKPTALMRYLVKLVTPPGGIVLDPFAGSGSTGKAANLEGFSFIGVELNAEYLNIATARIEAA